MIYLPDLCTGLKIPARKVRFGDPDFDHINAKEEARWDNSGNHLYGNFMRDLYPLKDREYTVPIEE